MEKRARWGMLLALLLMAAAGITILKPGKDEERRSVTFPVMGTTASLTFYTNEENFLQAVSAVKEEFARITALADWRNEKSELARLNKEAAQAPFVCSELMWEILSEARLAFALSEGAFDISVKPLMDHWGFYRKKLKKLPSPEETARVRDLTGLDKIKFDDTRKTILFPRKGFALDLGGIAKGFAIELAARRVVQMGIRQGVIDLGGNLRLLPEPPPGKKYYSIGIRRPTAKGGVMPEILRLQGNKAVSSSGDYHRFVRFGDKRLGHIMDPAAGTPFPGKIAVTAVADSGGRADWLSTAVCLRNRPLAEKLKKKLPMCKFYIIDKEKL